MSPSRQYERQQANIAAGLCGACGAKRPKGLKRNCAKHQLQAALRARRKLGCAAWRPGSRGRPPYWYTALVKAHGRAHADAVAAERAAASDRLQSTQGVQP